MWSSCGGNWGRWPCPALWAQWCSEPTQLQTSPLASSGYRWRPHGWHTLWSYSNKIQLEQRAHVWTLFRSIWQRGHCVWAQVGAKCCLPFSIYNFVIMKSITFAFLRRRISPLMLFLYPLIPLGMFLTWPVQHRFVPSSTQLHITPGCFRNWVLCLSYVVYIIRLFRNLSFLLYFC